MRVSMLGELSGAIAHEIPNAFGHPGGVTHPGNRAYPYLEPVGEQLAPFAPGILEKNYP